MTLRIMVLLGTLLLSPAVSSQASADAGLASELRQAQELIQAQDYSAALARLEALESRYAGLANYDYWYGVAALRAGQVSLALLALERAIATDPNHAGARLELAATYLALNRLERAEQELAEVERFNPPPAAQQAIADYRQVIAERRARALEGSHLVMLSLDAGYDSNYLNYPSSFDLFQNTFLEGLAILSADDTTFTNARGMWFYQRDLDANRFIEASVATQWRINNDSAARAFDTGIVQGSVVYGLRVDASNTARYGLDIGQVWLDGDYFRRHYGLLVGWQYEWDTANVLHANFRARDFSFDDSRNDYRASQIELEWQHRYAANFLLRSRYAYELERIKQFPTRQGGDASRNGLSLQAEYNFSANQQWLGQLGYQQLRYFTPGFSVFNLGVDEQRRDHVRSARLEWLYQWSPEWRVGASALFRDQSSSIDFFNLDQSLLQWTVTYVY